MSRLSAHLNSAYIAAASRLEGRTARPRVVAYVESYDDILFWRDALTEAAPHVQFEVVLPSRLTLGRGKKIALANRLGPHMIACVDADYDFLMQGATPTSETVCRSPYVVHTFVYAIENLQCHAEVLDRVCVMATLNDRTAFDFRAFLTAFSRIIHPLLVWNVWAYRYGYFTHFSLTDFARTVEVREVPIHHPERMIEALRRRVNRQIASLQRRFPQARDGYKPLRAEMERLGVTPETAYLYMRGHDLADVVVGPILAVVCDVLRREREREITRLACHAVQQQNELAAYRHAIAPVEEMLRKHTAYHATPEFRRIVAAVRALFPAPDGAEGEELFGTDGMAAPRTVVVRATDLGRVPTEADFMPSVERAVLYHEESAAVAARSVAEEEAFPPAEASDVALDDARPSPVGSSASLIEPGEDWDTEVD